MQLASWAAAGVLGVAMCTARPMANSKDGKVQESVLQEHASQMGWGCIANIL